MKVFIGDEVGKVVQFLRSGRYESYYEDSYEGAKGDPFFMVGHIQEIANRLMEAEHDSVKKYRKYPLIALRLDTKETVRGDMVDYTLNMIIATYTQKGYRAQERIDNIYKPVLYPLYDKFFDALRLVGKFQWDSSINQGRPPHDAIDRLYFGTYAKNGDMTSANIFSDPLDAIEIQNLKFTLEITNC